MIIISKKKILFYLSCFIIPILFFQKINIVPVSSLPINSKTILIDAGHGLPDKGASSSDFTTEESINLIISLKLQNYLEESGYSVILTRADENGIHDPNSTNKKQSDLKNRVNIANNLNPDICISIHLNKCDIPSCKGHQTFYQPNNEKSKQLAQNIQSSLDENINPSNKRHILPLENKYLLNNIHAPTVIVECGFLSNLADLNNLKTLEYQEKLAWGIYLGIIDFFQ